MSSSPIPFPPPFPPSVIESGRRTILIAYWIGGLLYGLLLCLFIGTLSMTFGRLRPADRHTKIMISIASVMFFVATFQVFMSAHMLLGAFTAIDSNPLVFVMRLDRWDSVIVSTLYTTQEILGGMVAVYQCFVLWNRNWKIIALPITLLLGKIVVGYVSCALFSLLGPTQQIFQPPIHSWIEAFYYLAVLQNFLTTSLMAYRIWQTSQRSSPYLTKRSALIPILRIIIECPALQLMTEILLLILFSFKLFEHYVLFQMVTPMVGISFNAVIIRVRLRAMDADSFTYQMSGDPVQTIGHAPTRINVQMTTEVEVEVDTALKPSPIEGTSDVDIGIYNRNVRKESAEIQEPTKRHN